MIKIAALNGDGIGPEIMAQGLRVLSHVAGKYNIDIEVKEAAFGGEAIDAFGHPFPDSTKEIVDESDAILLGAVGGDRWNGCEVRPEHGLLSLRKYLKAYCNLRPIICFEPLMAMSPIKHEGPIDLCFVRELTGGIYFGEKGEGEDFAYDVEKYATYEIERIAKCAFDLAKQRSNKVTSIDKSNVLNSSKLWRKTVTENNPGVSLNHMYVDNAAMQLILNPSQFDVVLTNNIFGDILSDEASVLAGSIGVLPSASIGDEKGLYEPIHGSAPDIAGENIANPIGMILSVAMMFQASFNRSDVYNAIYNGVKETLSQGFGTVDLKLPKRVTTSEWTDRLIENI